MPLYDYACTACGHELEALQGIKEEPLKDCPNCGQSALKRKVSAPAFKFKGGGWYKDLYGSSGAAKNPSKSGSGASKDSGSSSKSDSGSSGNKAAAS